MSFILARRAAGSESAQGDVGDKHGIHGLAREGRRAVQLQPLRDRRALVRVPVAGRTTGSSITTHGAGH